MENLEMIILSIVLIVLFLLCLYFGLPVLAKMALISIL